MQFKDAPCFASPIFCSPSLLSFFKFSTPHKKSPASSPRRCALLAVAGGHVIKDQRFMCGVEYVLCCAQPGSPGHFWVMIGSERCTARAASQPLNHLFMVGPMLASAAQTRRVTQKSDTCFCVFQPQKEREITVKPIYLFVLIVNHIHGLTIPRSVPGGICLDRPVHYRTL